MACPEREKELGSRVKVVVRASTHEGSARLAVFPVGGQQLQ